MRAVRIDEFGGPEVLKVVEIERPEPGPGEVLIRVSRAGMNFADTHQRHNQYLAKATLPLVPGQEVVGTREDTGERVIALCGTGGYAQYALAREDRTWPVPEGVADDTAIALLIQGLTAWHLHRTSAQLRPGDSVVVHGAAGGTGQMILQLAKPMGAGRVIATASTEDKRKRAEELGADVAVDSEPEGLGERLTRANDGRELDVIYEMAGGQSFDESFSVLAPFGRIVAYGIATREQNEVRTGKLLRTSRSVVGFWFNHIFERPGWAEDALADLFARAARGEVRAEIGGTWPLEQAADAQVALAERRTTGKLLLDPNA
ncbi:MAG: zinc-binding alcohol dehydrogenase family protein [Solirubrobacteraceae bacterium]